MGKYCYVYVLRSLQDTQFYVGEGCCYESDAARREKYLKTAWGKRYIKSRIRRYLTG
jgi:hypothetical protein